MQVIREARPDPRRQRLLRRAMLITILGNLVLAVGKGVVAYTSDSTALYADAANSVSDLLYSLLLTWGLWMAQRPPDLSHPQGHSRFEPLAGLIVAAAMTFAGYEAGRVAIFRFLEGGVVIPPGWPTAVLLLSAGTKVGMYGAIHGIAGRAASSGLDAVATDNLADVLTSVAALLGTVGSRYLHPLTDPIAGLLVAAWIFKSAYGVWRENLTYLTGGGAPTELRGRIVDRARTVEGVLRVHQVITEHVGPEWVADIHIDVDGNLPLFDAHAISDEVQARVEELPGIDRAYVHAEPSKVIPRQDGAPCP
jgi:cation diffusion facilitator family transporter